ncbi:glycerophosphodiester phosphodiesterase family protein [Actinocatenispora rupis]|uniref:GP-PDE domain-containing protein n=1 Tax=Actinocatenispora rupis TaxID=519421 RepID=A0A8J3JCA8_9ACTN|nr:glycerophosphodiester phosphodiesterase family protein [Actinocatenispora rupis]GID14124.1 hypothetical protein Aru02nite_50130 [Actinocatenispora rupis]
MSAKAPWPPVGTCVAHRGACGTTPENTVVGCVEAIRQGALAIEVDLQRTSDDELVIAHDSTMARTTDIAQVLPDRADTRLAELSLAELRKLDAGSWFDPRFAGATVPTLGELLDAIAGRATLLVEMKWPDRFPGIEAQLVTELRRCLGPALDRADLPPVALQATDPDLLRTLRDLVPPTVPLVLMTGVRPPLDLADFAGLGDWISAYVPLGRELPDGYVDAVHGHGVRVLPWTVDAPEGVAAMAALGADGVITNHLPYAAPVLRGDPSGLARTPVRVARASVPDEYTVLTADADTDLGGWALRNQLMERQWLPDTTLAAGADLVMPAPDPAYLDNYGDTLTLYDPTGAVVDLHFYR